MFVGVSTNLTAARTAGAAVVSPGQHGMGFWLAHLLLAGTSIFLLCSPIHSQILPPTPSTRPAMPQTPGFHNLYLTVRLDGQDRKLAYSVYLPRGYNPDQPWPMLVYLIGRGDRGENHNGLFNNGPTCHLKIDQSLAEWMPMIVLAPQCPPDQRWEAPDMSAAAVQVIESAKQSWAVDRVMSL